MVLLYCHPRPSSCQWSYFLPPSAPSDGPSVGCHPHTPPAFFFRTICSVGRSRSSACHQFLKYDTHTLAPAVWVRHRPCHVGRCRLPSCHHFFFAPSAEADPPPAIIFKYDAHHLAPAVWFGAVPASSADAGSRPAITFQNILISGWGGGKLFASGLRP